MSEMQRYAYNINHEMVKSTVGNYCRWEDAEALQSENKRLRKTIEDANRNSYPGLAVNESTLLNRIYKLTGKALKEPSNNKEAAYIYERKERC